MLGLSKALAVALTLLVMGMVPAGQSQEATPAAGKIYFTNKLVADGLTGAGSKVYEATDAEPIAATSLKAYHTAAAVAASLDTAFQWKVTAPFEIEGPVTATFWVSCDVATVYRGVAAATFRFTFQKNGAGVGTATSLTDASPSACTGPTSIREVKAVVNAPATSWKVGDTIGASIGIWAANPPEQAAKNLHFLVGSAKHPSQISAAGLPGGAPEPVGPVISSRNATLEGPTASVNESFANTTSGLHVYEWATNGTQWDLNASMDITNGTVLLDIQDGAGESVYNETWTNATKAFEVALNATSGDWTLRLNFTDFVGSLAFTVAPAAPIAPSNETTAPASNETATPQADEKAAVPGFGAVAVAAGLLVAVALRRRRA